MAICSFRKQILLSIRTFNKLLRVMFCRFGKIVGVIRHAFTSDRQSDWWRDDIFWILKYLMEVYLNAQPHSMIRTFETIPWKFIEKKSYNDQSNAKWPDLSFWKLVVSSSVSNYPLHFDLPCLTVLCKEQIDRRAWLIIVYDLVFLLRTHVFYIKEHLNSWGTLARDCKFQGRKKYFIGTKSRGY